MSGFITEMHLDAAEEDFPGIRAFFAACSEKPKTFLELVASYLGMVAGKATRSAGPSRPSR